MSLPLCSEAGSGNSSQGEPDPPGSGADAGGLRRLHSVTKPGRLVKFVILKEGPGAARRFPAGYPAETRGTNGWPLSCDADHTVQLVMAGYG